MENHPLKYKKNLPVMEHFYTIQGEGYHQGKPAYFIRLGGCDVGCIWCDVKESWDASQHPSTSPLKLLEAVQATPTEIVVITGGEPLMYDLDPLTEMFQAAKYKTHIETSGAYPPSGTWDWFCFSPKKFKSPHPDAITLADELKVVVYNKHDLKWAETFERQVPKSCKLFLQPEWSKEKEMLPLIIDFVKENPQWQISLQTHKYMGVE